MHPAALAARLRPYLFDCLPESERAIGDREFGTNRQPTPFQIEEQFPPRFRTLAYTVGESDKFFLSGNGCLKEARKTPPMILARADESFICVFRADAPSAGAPRARRRSHR